jgi:hypothetical protein
MEGHEQHIIRTGQSMEQNRWHVDMYVHRDYASHMYLIFHARGKQVRNAKLLIVDRELVENVCWFWADSHPTETSS